MVVFESCPELGLANVMSSWVARRSVGRLSEWVGVAEWLTTAPVCTTAGIPPSSSVTSTRSRRTRRELGDDLEDADVSA